MECRRVKSVEIKNKIENNRIAVFIDAANLWSSYKSMELMLDMNKVAPFLAKKFDGPIFKIFYYVAYPKEGTREKDKIKRVHNFFVFLEKGLNFNVVKKPLKTILLRNRNGEIIIDQKTKQPATVEKGNLDVELTMDVLKYSNDFNIAVFFTGDSDFLSLIVHLRSLKLPKKVYIFSTIDSVSEELKTGGDGYFDLKDCNELHQCKLLNQQDRKKQLAQKAQAVSMEY